MTEERKQQLREIFVRYPSTEWLNLVRSDVISHAEYIFLYAQLNKVKKNSSPSTSELDSFAKEMGGEVID